MEKPPYGKKHSVEHETQASAYFLRNELCRLLTNPGNPGVFSTEVNPTEFTASDFQEKCTGLQPYWRYDACFTPLIHLVKCSLWLQGLRQRKGFSLNLSKIPELALPGTELDCFVDNTTFLESCLHHFPWAIEVYPASFSGPKRCGGFPFQPHLGAASMHSLLWRNSHDHLKTFNRA